MMKKPLLFILSSLLCFSISTYFKAGLFNGSSHGSFAVGELNIHQSEKDCAHYIIICKANLVSGARIAEQEKLQQL